MLLAGGRGSRLGVLTKNLAKPAVPFGGKYRIIDFPLSNCVNSGIETVGVLTQYQPLELNEYIGSGQPWDLDSMNAGVHILQPYEQSSGSDWYKGTKMRTMTANTSKMPETTMAEISAGLTSLMPKRLILFVSCRTASRMVT